MMGMGMGMPQRRASAGTGAGSGGVRGGVGRKERSPPPPPKPQPAHEAMYNPHSAHSQQSTFSDLPAAGGVPQVLVPGRTMSPPRSDSGHSHSHGVGVGKMSSPGRNRMRRIIRMRVGMPGMGRV